MTKPKTKVATPARKVAGRKSTASFAPAASAAPATRGASGIPRTAESLTRMASATTGRITAAEGRAYQAIRKAVPGGPVIGAGPSTGRTSSREQRAGNVPKHGRAVEVEDSPRVVEPTVRMSSQTQSEPSPLDYDLASLEATIAAAGSYLRDLEFRIAPVSIYVPVDKAHEPAVDERASPVQERVQACRSDLVALIERICDATNSLII